MRRSSRKLFISRLLLRFAFQIIRESLRWFKIELEQFDDGLWPPSSNNYVTWNLAFLWKRSVPKNNRYVYLRPLSNHYPRLSNYPLIQKESGIGQKLACLWSPMSKNYVTRNLIPNKNYCVNTMPPSMHQLQQNVIFCFP